MPIAARRRAHPAKLAKSHIIERGSETEDATTDSMVSTSLTGTSGFTLATISRIPAATRDGSPDVRTNSDIATGICRFRATACG